LFNTRKSSRKVFSQFENDSILAEIVFVVYFRQNNKPNVEMGIALGIQRDHSKSYTLNIRVPNPIVTFSTFPSDESLFKNLQEDGQYILQSTLQVLPPDYPTVFHRLFAFLDNSQSTMKVNILKYASVADSKDILNQLSQLESHTSTIKTVFEMLFSLGIVEEDRQSALTACREIIRYFSDEDGILFKKYFLTTPCLVTFAGVYQSLVQFWGRQDDHKNEMALLAATMIKYKQKCIQERLDNIKMLRTQSESYNLHDYSYEAQIRKDVSFGGTINDFYDKRPTDEINFRDRPLKKATDADLILDGYKNEVKREYELFFASFSANQSLVN